MNRLGLLVASLLLAAVTTARAVDTVQITAKRTLETAKDEKTKMKHTAAAGHDGSYDIEITNATPKETGPLVVQYRIFIEREHLGEKRTGDTVERVEGSIPQPSIAPRQKATLTTKEFTLSESKMKSNLKRAFVPAVSGGRIEAKDSTKGIWVRVYQGETVVGELINPAALKDQQLWEQRRTQ